MLGYGIGAQVGDWNMVIDGDPLAIFQVKTKIGVRELPERQDKDEHGYQNKRNYPFTILHSGGKIWLIKVIINHLLTCENNLILRIDL